MVTIKWPRPDRPVFNYCGAFAAFGRSSIPVRWVTATCVELGVENPRAVEGVHAQFFEHEGLEPEGKFRWSILLKVALKDKDKDKDRHEAKPTKYRLTVTVHASVNESAKAHVDVYLNQDDPEASILWPPSDEDISAFKYDFCPYGGLIGLPLGSVSLTNQSTQEQVGLLYAIGDYATLELWCAQFDTLQDGCYTLEAKDVDGQGEPSLNLKVNCNSCS